MCLPFSGTGSDAEALIEDSIEQMPDGPERSRSIESDYLESHMPSNQSGVLHIYRDRDCSESGIHREAEEALRLARRATDAYRHGLSHRAACFRAAAEQLHTSILAAICHLTDEEADRIEPKVTELERELSRFPTAEEVHIRFNPSVPTLMRQFSWS
jgi:hypothetical protein